MFSDFILKSISLFVYGQIVMIIAGGDVPQQPG